MSACSQHTQQKVALGVIRRVSTNRALPIDVDCLVAAHGVLHQCDVAPILHESYTDPWSARGQHVVSRRQPYTNRTQTRKHKKAAPQPRNPATPQPRHPGNPGTSQYAVRFSWPCPPPYARGFHQHQPSTMQHATPTTGHSSRVAGDVLGLMVSRETSRTLEQHFTSGARVELGATPTIQQGGGGVIVAAAVITRARADRGGNRARFFFRRRLRPERVRGQHPLAFERDGQIVVRGVAVTCRRRTPAIVSTQSAHSQHAVST